MIEPQQGTTYETVRELAATAERLGFHGFFTSDHYLVFGDTDPDPGPLDAWITLAGLARDTERLRLGTLVTAAPFRLPGPFTIAVTEVDHMSGGRVEVGMGAGWYEPEYPATGVPFGTTASRFDNLTETLEIMVGWWTTPAGETFVHDGDLYQIEGPALPKALQHPHPPIIIGGFGKVRTPALVAAYAAEFNVPFASIDDTKATFDRVRGVCVDHGRDPNSVKWSAAAVLCVGADENELAARAAAIGREPEELREAGVAGLPDEAAAKLRRYRDDAGCERVYLQALNIDEPAQLEVVADQVLPLL